MPPLFPAFGYNHASSATAIALAERAIPSIICSFWESPELGLPPVPLVLVREGFDAEDVGEAEATSPFKSVAVCEERPLEVGSVVIPVAPATGTRTEPAVTVVVDEATESPSAALPHINMTEGRPIGLETQPSSFA